MSYGLREDIEELPLLKGLATNHDGDRILDGRRRRAGGGY